MLEDPNLIKASTSHPNVTTQRGVREASPLHSNEDEDPYSQGLQFKLQTVIEDLEEMHAMGTSAEEDDSKAPLFGIMAKGVSSLYERFLKIYDECCDACGPWGLPEEVKRKRGAAKLLYYNISLQAEQINNKKSSSTTIQNIAEHTFSGSYSRPRAKLPTIKLPEFNGDRTDWIRFRDTFQSLVLQDPDLSPMDKFHYLTASLKDSAKSVIADIPLSETNFTVAWQALVEAFDNPRLIATAFLDKLLSMETIKNRPSNDQLKDLTNKLSEWGAAFSQIMIEDRADFLIFYLARRCLDFQTKQAFELQQDHSTFPKFNDLIRFLRQRCTANELAVGINSSPVSLGAPKQSSSSIKYPRLNFRVHRGRSSLFSSPAISKSNPVKQIPEQLPSKPVFSTPACPTCNRFHALIRCVRFNSMTPEERVSHLKGIGWKGCENCLFNSHSTKQCTSRMRCRLCRHKHHTLIHVEGRSSPHCMGVGVSPEAPSKATPTEVKASTSAISPALSATTGKTLQIVLGTAVCSILDCKGRPRAIRLALDSGSQFSFLTRQAAIRLGLPIKNCNIDILGIGQTPFTGFKGKTFCKLVSNREPTEVSTQALVVETITSDLPTSLIPETTREPYEEYSLADPNFWEPGPIDFLLGGDLFAEILTGDIITLAVGQPKLIGTIFGYVVLGRMSDLSEACYIQAMCATARHFQRDKTSLVDDLQHLWEVDDPEMPRPVNPDDAACEKFFTQSFYRLSTGRYVVRLPFKVSEPHFPSTRWMAIKRLANVETKLTRNSNLCQLYRAFMEEYETLGHMTRATSPGKYIIPHHCVSKVENSKTKIRVVFDASASTHVGSLNDHLHIGPKLQNSIIDIMLNFRRHKIVFTVDLVKMFRQILVHPKDRAYQHVLWRKDLSESVQEYELCTVSYGQASAPYLAIRSIKQLVKDEGSAYPLAAAAVEEDMYVDDLATGSSTIEEALELQRQVIALMSKGEFPLSKWASNHPDLLQVAEDSEVSGLPKRIENPEDRIRFKILGLQWDPVTDRFTYEVSPPEPVFTKRAILASISRIYDPLGLLGPVVITAKAIIQSAWKAKITWDEVLPVHIQDQWRIFLQQLPELRRLEIPRWVANSCPSSYDILIFGDASELAYCATAYLRTSHIGGVEMHLLMSKTKLAPIKVLSIPRLELCAAVLAVKLADQLVNFYRKLPMLPTVYFFTDATIVLGWLNTPAYLLKTFVANRVTRILLTTSTAQWFHVKSADNPSDLGSRGITISSLVGNNLWFHGPDWATQDPSTWPVTSTSTIPQEINGIPELKPACAMVAAPQVNEIYNFICSSSSYLRLIRTVAWMSRFIRNSQLPHSQRSVGALSLQELKGSLLLCIKLTQQEGFSHGRSLSTKALPKGLHSLRPFLDDMGLLRVGGRLGKSSLSPQTRTPLILPVKSHLSGLIVDFYHRMFLHPGPSLLLSFLRRKYWIIGARDLVRHYCRNCVSCRRLQAPTCQPLMGDLPVERFQIGRAFLNVGLDFAGPFLIRESLRRKAPQSKCYLCLFICLSSKAIHLEAVSALSTPAFFEAFDRFISRRGLPRVIMSDNGSNFKGAARQLKDWYAWYAQEEVQCRFKDYASHYEIQWKFGPPHAPHFGGIWEAGIRSVKRLLRSAYGEGVFTFEELSTMLSRIEAILNSRPMCQLSSDPEDLDALTPGHLLIGGPLIVPPEPLLLGIKETHLARWQIVQQRTQYFWKRWKDEYIHQLQLRNKWRTPERNLQVNDLVLVMGETTDRLSWPLGRVIEIFPGWDGVVRVVSIRTSKTVLKRPVTKLVPILLHDSNFT